MTTEQFTDLNTAKINNNMIFLISTIFTISSILAIWLWWQNVLLLFLVLVGLAVVELMVIKSKKLFLAYLIVCFGGPLVEVVAIYLGAWQYTLPTFLGIPLWLVPAWGNAGIIAIIFYKLFSKLINNKALDHQKL